MNQPAVRFLNRCFAPAETIALLLRREIPPSITQRVVRLERAMESRYQAWLSYENGRGANVYVAANLLLRGSRKRTKKDIASVRHLYIDIDTDGDTRLAALRASDCAPYPSAILSTSPRKYQVLWRVEGFDFDRQEQTLKLLAMAFGGDPACTDCKRVLRIPGFLNRKYDPAFRITVEYPDDPTSPNPLYYAQRTFDIASAPLWLLEGIRIDDVITMLESRHRFEIPTVIVEARAREIAVTAERMIARRKSA